DGRERVANHVDLQLSVLARAEERLDRGQRQRGVVRLVLAVHGQQNLVVHAAEALQLQHLAADGDLALHHTELLPGAGDRGIHLDGPFQQHTHDVRVLFADDRHRPRLDHPGLLRGDRLEVLPEVVGVVQADRGDRGDLGVGHRRGVPTATHADLDHSDRSEEHTSELQSRENLVCRLLLEKKKTNRPYYNANYS